MIRTDGQGNERKLCVDQVHISPFIDMQTRDPNAN